MKRVSLLLFALFGAWLMVAVSGCGGSSSDGGSASGTLSLSLTDAPLDNIDHVSEVNVTITSIEYHADGAWHDFTGFSGPKMFNLLALTEGNIAELGDANLSAGHYTQLRFNLDAPVDNGGTPANPGCFIAYDDGTPPTPLFVPSGAQTGIKAIGEYDVPVNGTVLLTADFDVRKSVVQAGSSGRYHLKPTIRLVSANEAGDINGTLLNSSGSTELRVYAYEDASYDVNETLDDDSDGILFENAVTSAEVHPDGSFKLAFLASGSYDLVVAGYTSGGFDAVLGYVNDVAVVSGAHTTLELDTATLSATY